MNTLFISDLHLQKQRPEITRAFFSFLDQKASKADSLYILGDFFEVWVGDDGTTAFEDDIIDRLKRLSKQCEIFFIHGNRDFLIGNQFAAQSKVTLLPDPTLITLNNETYLILHGDSLCTEDHEYMKFRKMVRDQGWQQEFLSKPLFERNAIARQLRETSKSETANKDIAITDVTQSEVDGMMLDHHCLKMIHGHTHRPAHHQFQLADGNADRWVLGDWCDTGWYIEATDAGVTLKQFKP